MRIAPQSRDPEGAGCGVRMSQNVEAANRPLAQVCGSVRVRQQVGVSCL